MSTWQSVRSAYSYILLASISLFLWIGLMPVASDAAQQSPLSPTATAEEVQTYEAFRSWITGQPADVQNADDEIVFARYAAVLRTQGKSERDAAATIASLKKIGDRAEIERWNRILTAPKPAFNTSPNAFLVAVTKGLKPGRSLDVGMGQGRNTIYLAQQGWDSVGFDPAERAVAAAQEQATKLGAKITTHVARAEDFDWGVARWDLIVLSYVGAREYTANVFRALRPGWHGRSGRLPSRRNEDPTHRRWSGIRHQRTAQAVRASSGRSVRRHGGRRRLRSVRYARRPHSGRKAIERCRRGPPTLLT